MNSTGLMGLVAGAAVLFALVGKASPRVVTLVPGRRYRFHFEVEPDLERTEADAFRAAIASIGTSVGLERSGDKTTGRFVMVATDAREVRLGEPMLQVGKHALSVQKVEPL